MRSLLDAYAAGVNAVIEESHDNPPMEFGLLDYRPEPWSPIDSLAVLGEFRWYLTGRFPVIVVPEMLKRTLGDGPSLRTYLQGEEDDESILHPGDYEPAGGRATVGTTTGEDGPGSNNWVLAGPRTTTGQPLVASDPHIPFAAVSIWHQIHLDGGSFHVAGVALAGVPAVMIGRNRDVAWGITNNICSQRDLYQEKTDPAHPGCFLYDGRWEPAREREEVIAVRGADPVRMVVRSSRNGPIVDDVLPAAARDTGPVSLRWLGAEPCGWLTALLGMNRATSCETFREATRPWNVPTFCLVYADRAGRIGYHAAGRIPRRHVAERGYRPGWEPCHQWDGLLAFEEMPHVADPARGYVVTANNRVAADDYPAPLSGTWATGHRARRLRELIEARPKLSREDCQAMQHDVRSGRAAACVPPLVAALAADLDPRVQEAVRRLRDWDFRATVGSVPAALFNVFFARWCRRVADEHFPPDAAALVATGVPALAARLLTADPTGWFRSSREDAIRDTFRAALDELTARLGPAMAGWTWGRLHELAQRHVLTARGDLGTLLDRVGPPAPGDNSTVNNGTTDAAHRSVLGAGYRLVADLADPACGLWSVESGSASGHPGSPHYDDQIAPWAAGEYHYTSLDGLETKSRQTQEFVLKPFDERMT